MRRRLVGLICCGLVVALVAPVALAQAGGDSKAKYEALRKASDALRKEMGKFRGKYDKDPAVAAARKDESAARKVNDEALKNSAAVAEGKKGVDAARKALAEEVNAAMAADAEAGPVLKKFNDATKRLAQLQEAIKKLTEQERKLRGELSNHQRRVSRNKDIGKDARMAVAAAEKVYAEAVENDAAVQAAKKASDEARARTGRTRQAKLEADPAYAELLKKVKDLDAQMKAARDAMRPKRAPRKAQKRKAE